MYLCYILFAIFVGSSTKSVILGTSWNLEIFMLWNKVHCSPIFINRILRSAWYP